MAPTLRWLVLVLATTTVAIAGPSCSSDKKGKSGKKQEGDTATGGDTAGKTGKGSTTGTSPCLTLDEDDKDNASDGHRQGDGLSLTLTDYSTIKDLIESKCVTCHPNAGQDEDYADREKVSADADKILRRMKDTADPMPPGAPLAAAEIKLFQDWIKGGKKTEGGSATTGDATTGTAAGGAAAGTAAGGSPADPCGTDGTTGTGTGSGTGDTGGATMGGGSTGSTAADPDPEFFVEFITPPEKKVCTSDGFFYNYEQRKCISHKLGTKIACTPEAMLAAFKNNAQVKAILDERVTGKKWIMDECGVTKDGGPAFTIICITEEGKEACVGKDQLKSLPKNTTLEILQSIVPGVSQQP